MGCGADPNPNPRATKPLLEAELALISVERLSEIAHVDQEAAALTPDQLALSPAWPTSGAWVRTYSSLSLRLRGVYM